MAPYPLLIRVVALSAIVPVAAQRPTLEFAIHDDLPYLGGEPVRLFGLRCGNALRDQPLTERLIRGLDTMADHGINLVSVHLQAANGGRPDRLAGGNPFEPDGTLPPDAADRLEWLVREADARGMVVMVSVLCGLWDQELRDEAAVQRAIESTAATLEGRGLRNVFVDLAYEFDHPTRIDHAVYREPDGAAKQARLAAWFHAIAPGIEVGVTTAIESAGERTFTGMDVRMIQKSEAIPATGFVVNTETRGADRFDDDGVLDDEQRAATVALCEAYATSPRTVMLWNSAFVQGITGASGTAPHFEPGGDGHGPDDRGVRCYYDWVRTHVGRWQYPHHVPPLAEPPAETTPTPIFAVRGDRAWLDAHQVRLFGLLAGNALVSPAVTERFIVNLDTMAAHGIDLLCVGMLGDDRAGTPSTACTAGFDTDGTLRAPIAARLEALIRAAATRQMVVLVTILSSARDAELDGPVAVRRAVETTADFLVSRGLRNVAVELATGLDDPTRAAAHLGDDPRTRLDVLHGWFHARAPEWAAGAALPGAPVRLGDLGLLAGAPIPPEGYWIDVGQPFVDTAANDGLLTADARTALAATVSRFVATPNAAFVLRSAYATGITNGSGAGPYAARGGDGSTPRERGLRTYFELVRATTDTRQ